MKINNQGIALIKQFEGLRQDAYICPAGKWTIGYGHTGPEVTPGLHWSLIQCEKALLSDLEGFEKDLSSLIKVPVTVNQFSALMSFMYNFGKPKLASSTLLKLLNKKEYLPAAEEFLKWNRSTGKVLKGLTVRREAERALFLSNVV